MNSIKIIGISLLILLIGYFGLRAIMWKYIQPDEVGVWMTNGGQNGPSDYQTWAGHFPLDINPLTKGFVIPAQPWTIDADKRIIYSLQKGEWSVDPEITFKVDRSQAPLVCFRNNSMLADNSREGKEKFLASVGKHLLVPIIYDVFLEIVATRTDSALMSNTYFYQKMVEDSLRIRFKKVGYELETFVSNLNPPETIIAKNRAKNDSEAAALTAKADVIKAEAEAKVKLANARADSEALLVTERANAEVLRLREKSLSPLLIQKEWIDKWDGALPTYMLGENTMLMMPK